MPIKDIVPKQSPSPPAGERCVAQRRAQRQVRVIRGRTIYGRSNRRGRVPIHQSFVSVAIPLVAM